MSLLRELLDNPLDAGYRAHPRVHAARAARPSWWRGVLVVVVCAVMAAGAVWSARSLRAPEGPTAARALLLEQVSQRQEAGEALRSVNAELQAEITALRDSALGDLGEASRDRLLTLGVAAGTVPVRGPGVVITLADSRAAREGQPGSEEERVQDVDLQVLVNALWASGAEAIAVNGERLSATSAIRAAGPAILVNLEPVVSPYRVEVLGPPSALQTELARTSAATHLGVLRTTFGITVEIAAAEDLELAAVSPALRYAVPRDAATPAVAPSGASGRAGRRRSRSRPGRGRHSRPGSPCGRARPRCGRVRGDVKGW